MLLQFPVIAWVVHLRKPKLRFCFLKFAARVDRKTIVVFGAPITIRLRASTVLQLWYWKPITESWPLDYQSRKSSTDLNDSTIPPFGHYTESWVIQRNSFLRAYRFSFVTLLWLTQCNAPISFLHFDMGIPCFPKWFIFCIR